MALATTPKPVPRVGGAFIERLLYWFAVYGVTMAVAVVSLIALRLWAPLFQPGNPEALRFQALQLDSPAMTPETATSVLASAPGADLMETKRSEAPFWFLFRIAEPQSRGARPLVELPSRHATAISCWRAADAELLGRVDRREAAGALSAAKGGFVLQTLDLAPGDAVVCKGQFVGPARITLRQWNPTEFRVSEVRFYYDDGWLQGGILVLLAFVLMTAVITREILYLTFAAWLAINLRLAALSAGTDIHWLGHLIPAEGTTLLRQISLSSYYILGVALFTQLFRHDMKRIGFMPLLRLVQWSCVPLLILTFSLSYAQFLPILWVMTTATAAVLIFLAFRNAYLSASLVAGLYGASVATTLGGAFAEVLGAAFGLDDILAFFNSGTSALASSIMVTLAIAEQMRQERAGKEQAERALRNAYQAIPIGLFTADMSGRLLQGNPAFLQLFEVRRVEDLGHWRDHLPMAEFDRLRTQLGTSSTCDQEIHAQMHGREVWLMVRARLSDTVVEASIQDVTERRKATDHLQFLADHDSLTRTLNRRGLEDRMTAALAKQEAVSVAYLDLERFKLINDLYGHAAGDEVLVQVCRRINENLGSASFLGRMGGDEFVIVFTGTDVDEAAAACRRIIATVEEAPYRLEDKAFRLRVSIGLVETPQGIGIADAISAAEQACRQAKKAHGTEPLVFRREANIFRDRAEELLLVQKFDTNRATEGLLLMMQPILSLQAPQRSLNFETLLRMRTPDGGIVPAGKVIATAENNGRIAVIDRWVMRTLLEWLDVNHDRLDATRFVCMNLSGGSLNDERFIGDALAMLAEHRRSAQRLCIEVTEGVALSDLGNTKKFIDRVRDYGTRIALDDFGAGYTSFSYLRHLPADVVKIDGGFVRDAHLSPMNLGIVATIADLARNLGMKTIAEWTESLESVRAMAEVGIDYVQGFAISRPVLPDEILARRSCADFVGDKETQQFLEMLGTSSSGDVARIADAKAKRGLH